MTYTFDNVSCTKPASAYRICLHGVEKVGKSTLFAGGRVRLLNESVTLDPAPNPIFIPVEDGLRGLSVDAFPQPERYENVIDALSLLSNEAHEYKTLIIDSADWLERLIHMEVIKTCGHDVRGEKTVATSHGGYGKGYEVALRYWRDVISWLDYLNKNKGMIIGIICHSSVVAFNDPMNEPFDRYEMKLHKPKNGTGARDLLCEWADIIGFAQKPVFVNRKKGVDGKERTAATSPKGQLNKLHLQGSPAYVAGNRFNLPETIDLSWQSLEKEMEVSQGA